MAHKQVNNHASHSNKYSTQDVSKLHGSPPMITRRAPTPANPEPNTSPAVKYIYTYCTVLQHLAPPLSHYYYTITIIIISTTVPYLPYDTIHPQYLQQTVRAHLKLQINHQQIPQKFKTNHENWNNLGSRYVGQRKSRSSLFRRKLCCRSRGSH